MKMVMARDEGPGFAPMDHGEEITNRSFLISVDRVNRGAKSGKRADSCLIYVVFFVCGPHPPSWRSQRYGDKRAISAALKPFRVPASNAVHTEILGCLADDLGRSAGLALGSQR